MTEDPRARRAAPDEWPVNADPTSGTTPSRAFEPLDEPAEPAFPANVRHRMASGAYRTEPSLRRSLGLTVVSTLVPGLGLLGATAGAQGARA